MFGGGSTPEPDYTLEGVEMGRVEGQADRAVAEFGEDREAVLEAVVSEAVGVVSEPEGLHEPESSSDAM